MNGSQERLSARPTIGTCQVILQCNMPALPLLHQQTMDAYKPVPLQWGKRCRCRPSFVELPSLEELTIAGSGLESLPQAIWTAGPLCSEGCTDRRCTLSGDRTDGHFEVRSCSLQPLETGESNATIVLRLLHLTDNSLKNLPASSMQKANLDLCIAEESCFQGKPRDARPSAKAGSRQEPTSATTRLPPGLPRPGCTSTSDLFENAPTQEPLAPEFSCARC